MRKKFVNVALFGALLVASLSLTTSCKDYDDDIANLQSQIDQSKTSLESSLSQQASTLQSALETAKQELNTAIQAAQSATSDADKKAEEAKAAAAQAKVDAIAEAQKLVDQLREQVEAGYVKAGDLASYATLEYVNGKISGIEDGLGVKIQEVLDGMGLTSEAVDALKGLGDLQNILTQLETQKAAIENFTKLLGENGEVLEAKLKANLDSANAAIDEKIAEHAKVLQNYVTKSDLATELGKYCTSEEVDSLLATIKADYGKQISDLETKVDGLSDKIGTVETELGKEIDDLNTTLSKKIDDDIAALSTKVEEVNGNLVTLLGKALRSLVFSPELYVGGIETVEYGYLMCDTFYYVGEFSKNKEEDFTHDERKYSFKPGDHSKLTAFPTAITYGPVDTIRYHMNPSSADLEGCELSFISKDVEAIKRAGGNDSKAAPELVGYEKENGMLKVFMRINNPFEISTDYKSGSIADPGDKLHNNAGGNDNELNIFALQANIEKGDADTTITSDYAGLYGSEIEPKAIAFSTKDYTDWGDVCDGAKTKAYNHLYTSAKEALTSDYALPLNWENKGGGVDLKKILCIHYKWATATKNAVDHGVWAYGEEAKYGLTYHYELIYYLTGGNSTSDSKYAKVSEDGVITAHNVDDKGNTLDETNEASVGREPLILVTVKCKDHVVLYGYIKAKIGEEQRGTVTLDAITKGGTVDDCKGGTYKVIWSEISSGVLAKLHMSNDDFNRQYEIEKAGTPEGDYLQDEVVQYLSVNGKYVKADGNKGNNKIGTVTELLEGAETLTSALEWAFDKCEQQSVYEKANHTATVYVRYKRKDGTKNDEVYLPLIVTVNRDRYNILDFKDYYTKKNEVWAWGDNKEPGMNVPVPDEETTEAAPYEQMFLTVFLGDKINFDALNEKLGIKKPEEKYDVNSLRFYFMNSECPNPKGGNNWKFVVKSTNVFSQCDTENKNKLAPTAQNAKDYPLDPEKGVYANTSVYLSSASDNQKIADINSTTGVITYAQTDAAKEVLNAFGTVYYSKEEKGAEAGLYPQAFLKVGVAIVAKNGECNGIIMPLENVTFNDYVLRPVNMTRVASKSFIEAEDNGSTLNVVDLVKFTDWRQLGFDKHFDYYKFYGFESVELSDDKTKVLSNMSSGDKFLPLSELAPKTDLTYTPGTKTFADATKAADLKDVFGTYTYKNNGTPIRTEFKLRIPVKVTYMWGTLEDYIEVTVKPVDDLG